MNKNKKLLVQQGKEQEETVKVKMRSAMSLLEAVFWIILVGIFLYGVFNSFAKSKANTKANVAHQAVTTFIGGVETSQRLNGGVYIAQTSKKVSDATMVNLANALGGTTNIKDVQDWTYTCAAGSASTLTVTTTNYDDTTVRDVVVALINSNNRPWTAVASGSAIAFSKANVVCR
jgi:type II secretory pathway pseudopilin PulG